MAAGTRAHGIGCWMFDVGCSNVSHPHDSVPHISARFDCAGHLPALAAIYILRNRFRRRTVSSLVLWRFHVQSKSGGAKIHRLQLPLLFFLELLALLLLVAAAAGPHWKLPQSTRPLIVVLDDSFSMRAVSGGISAQDRARAFLEKLFHTQPPPSTRLILAGTEAHSLGSPVKSGSQVDELLRQWHCWSPDAALDPAITLAAELGRQQANILVLTDHKPALEKISNNRLEWHAFGAPADNFAIVNASRTAFGGTGPLPAGSRQFFQRGARDKTPGSSRLKHGAKFARFARRAREPAVCVQHCRDRAGIARHDRRRCAGRGQRSAIAAAHSANVSACRSRWPMKI